MKKNSRKVAALILLVLLGFFLFFFRGWFKLNPFEQEKMLDSVYAANTDAAGNYYIIDSGTFRIIKTDAERQIQFVLESDGQYNGEFFNAHAVVMGLNDTLYVHDVVWDIGGMHVQSEKISLFSAGDGSYLRTLWQEDYALRPRGAKLKGLVASDGRLYYLNVDGDAIQLLSLSSNGLAPELIRSYPYANAADWIQDCELDMQAGKVYLLEKNGTVRLASEDGVHPTLFTPEAGDFSLPHAMALQRETGTLYLNDVGGRAIYALSPEGEYTLFSEVDDALTKMDFSQTGQILTAVSYDTVYVLGADGQMVESFNQVDMPWVFALRAVLYYLAALAVLFLLVVVLRWLVQYLRVGKAKAADVQKIVLASCLGIVLASVCILPIALGNVSDSSKQGILNRLSFIASAASKTLDTKAFENIHSPQDYGNEDYQNLTASMEDMLQFDEYSGQDFYCVLYKVEDGRAFSVKQLDNNTSAFYPEFDDITDTYIDSVLQSSGIVVEELELSTGTFLSVSGPVFGEGGQVLGVIEIGMDANAIELQIQQQLVQILILVATILVLLYFALSQSIDAITSLLHKKQLMSSKQFLPIAFISPITFLFYLAFNLCTSFVVVYVAQRSAGVWGIPPLVCASLTLMAGQILAAVSSVICAPLLRGIGLRGSLLAGALMCVVGDTVSGFASSFGMLMISISLAGFGSGIIFSVLNIYAAGMEDEEEKSRALANYNTSSFSGIYCGMLLGGTLASAVGQSSVFFVAAGVWLLALVGFIWLTKRRSEPVFKKGESNAKLRKLITPATLVFLLLAWLPYIIRNGFVYYFIPVLGAENLGMTEAEIGLVLALLGVVISFVGNPLSRITNALHRPKLVVAVAGAISIVSVLVVGILPTIPVLVVSVLLMGLSNSFGHGSHMMYYSNLKPVRAVGVDNAFWLYSFTENIGDAISPVFFNTVVLAGMQLGLVGASVGFGGLLVLFYVFGVRQRSVKAATEALV